MKTRSHFVYPKMYLYRRIVAAKVFIDDNYSQPIDVDNIAQEASFSKYHFIRLFKSSYGLTPHQYLTEVRVKKARELLVQGYTVSEVCSNLGFDSLSSFTGLFKRRVGKTPTAYQKEWARKGDQIVNSPLSLIPSCFAQSYGWRE